MAVQAACRSPRRGSRHVGARLRDPARGGQPVSPTFGALQFAPTLLLSAWAGLLADRVPRRALLFGTQAAQCLLAVGLGVLVLSGHVQLWHVGVFAALLGLSLIH